MVLVVRQLRVKILSSELPALCVGDVVVRVRSKDLRRDSVAVDWDGSGRLKSPSRTRGAPSSGKELRSMSISSRKFPREPGGRYRTMIVRVNGTDTATAWNSKEEMERLGTTITVDTQEREVRRPVPPPRPVDLGVWEKLYAAERAAGVDEFWAVIQVSLSARNWRPCVYAKEEIKSAFFTADWQFHKAPATEIGVLVALGG